MPTTLDDVLHHHGLLRKTLIEMLYDEDVPGISANSFRGPVANFRLVSKLCLACSYDTDILRLKAVGPPLPIDGQFEPLRRLLLAHKAVTKLELIIPKDSGPSQVDLSFPIFLIAESLPGLLEFEHLNHSVDTYKFPEQLLVRFKLLKHLSLMQCSFTGSPILPSQLITINLHDIFEDNPNIDKSTTKLDVSGLEQLTSINIDRWHGLQRVLITCATKGMKLFISSCSQLSAIMGCCDSCSVDDLCVVNCDSLNKLYHVIGRTTRDIGLIDTPQLLTPCFRMCEELCTLKLDRCMCMVGILDLRDLKITKLMVGNCQHIKGLWLSGCARLSKLDIFGMEGIASLDLYKLQIERCHISDMEGLRSLHLDTLSRLELFVLDICPLLIGELDFSNCSALVRLVVISCPCIHHIKFRNTTSSLQELVIRSCINLIPHLNCSGMSQLKTMTLIDCSNIKSVQVGGVHPSFELRLQGEENSSDIDPED